MPRATFYTWYRRYAEGGLDGRAARPPRELAWQFTDREGHFLSESSVYRILKAFDLITSPAFVALGGPGVSAADAPAERAVVNRLYVSPRGGLGLVLLVDRAR